MGKSRSAELDRIISDAMDERMRQRNQDPAQFEQERVRVDHARLKYSRAMSQRQLETTARYRDTRYKG